MQSREALIIGRAIMYAGEQISGGGIGIEFGNVVMYAGQRGSC
jgi:hypothetical protein